MAVNQHLTGTDLSVVIPAFNEVQRLPLYLEELRRYFGTGYKLRVEIIVVDDGSSDGTPQLVRAAARDFPVPLRCISHATNQGKGAAVRTGVFEAAGKLVLFADADGSTPISEESTLRRLIREGSDVAVGARLSKGANIRRSVVRGVGSFVVSSLVRCVLDTGVKDTQCGFKMFRRPVARRAVSAQQEDRFAFDIELLVICRRLGFLVAETPISWVEKQGSKVSFLDTLDIARATWRIRRRYCRKPLSSADYHIHRYVKK